MQEINTLEQQVRTLELDVERLCGQVKEQEEREKLERDVRVACGRARVYPTRTWQTADLLLPVGNL